MTGEARGKYYHSIYKINGFSSCMCVCINLWEHLAKLSSFIIGFFMISSSTKVCVLLCQRVPFISTVHNLFEAMILCFTKEIGEKKISLFLLHLHLSHFIWQLVLMPSAAFSFSQKRFGASLMNLWNIIWCIMTYQTFQ